MTPEQKRVLLEKAQEYSYDDSIGQSSAADICAFVESLIAAERAATVERCALVADRLANEFRLYTIPAALRALPKDANG